MKLKKLFIYLTLITFAFSGLLLSMALTTTLDDFLFVVLIIFAGSACVIYPFTITVILNNTLFKSQEEINKLIELYYEAINKYIEAEKKLINKVLNENQ